MLNNFPSDFQPVLSLDASRDYEGADIDVSIYRYQNADAFISAYSELMEIPDWAILNKSDYGPDISGLTLFKSYVLPLTFMDETNYSAYLALPENLPQGNYLIFLKSGELEDYAFIQINDMQLYASIGEKESLIWVNDMITGRPAANAVFEGNGIRPVKTDSQGIALVGEELYKNNKGRNICFKVTRDGHPALVAPIYNASNNSSGYDKDKKTYWSVLYFDRSNYLPTDSVKIWGYLRPRDGSPPPDSLTLRQIS